MDLTCKPSNSVEFGGNYYIINFAFDNILLIIKLLKDSRISESVKIEGVCELLEPHPQPKDRTGFVIHVLNNYIFKGTSGEATEEPAFDFFIDAGHIQASFLQDYGINLLDELGKMHWEEFQNLFCNLSEETTMKKVIQIRTCKLPKPTKYNAEEISHLKRLKLAHSLSVKRDPEIQREIFERKMVKWMDSIKKR